MKNSQNNTPPRTVIFHSFSHAATTPSVQRTRAAALCVCHCASLGPPATPTLTRCPFAVDLCSVPPADADDPLSKSIKIDQFEINRCIRDEPRGKRGRDGWWPDRVRPIASGAVFYFNLMFYITNEGYMLSRACALPHVSLASTPYAELCLRGGTFTFFFGKFHFHRNTFSIFFMWPLPY